MKDDIIIYKEDNGIVYAYFNKNAFDIYLYNRAKERTNDFSIPDKRKDYGGRSLILNDLYDIVHTVYNKPIIDGEYVSKGDFVLLLGLNATNVCKEYEFVLSPFWETWIMWGVKIYSSYEGYFTNCIECKIGRIWGTDIKDRTLLFTIDLAKKPEEPFTPIKDVKFTYSMLSKEYLDSIEDFGFDFKNWLVLNYTRIKEGDDVLEIEESKYSDNRLASSIKATYSGIIVFRFSPYINKGRLHKGDIMYTIYSNEESLKDSYPNVITQETDDFTKGIIIKGSKCGGNLMGFQLGPIFLNFENCAGKTRLLLRFCRKDINLNKKCGLHLMLDDDSIITLNAVSNPIKESKTDSSLKFLINAEDLIRLETKNFLKWQITNEDGEIIKSGNNTCCVDINDSTGITERLSYEVFRDFIEKFNKTIQSNFTEEEHEIEEILKDKPKDGCYVYLMIDTTNNFYKIGISNHPEYREHTLQSDKPTIELLKAKRFPSRVIAEAIESSLHKVFANKRIRGEWFNLNETEVDEVKQTLQ